MRREEGGVRNRSSRSATGPRGAGRRVEGRVAAAAAAAAAAAGAGKRRGRVRRRRERGGGGAVVVVGGGGEATAAAGAIAGGARNPPPGAADADSPRSTGVGGLPDWMAVARSHARHSAYCCLRSRSASRAPKCARAFRNVPAALNASTCFAVAWPARSARSARSYTRSANSRHTARSVTGSTRPAWRFVASSVSTSCTSVRCGRASAGAAMPSSTACSRPGRGEARRVEGWGRGGAREREERAGAGEGEERASAAGVGGGTAGGVEVRRRERTVVRHQRVVRLDLIRALDERRELAHGALDASAADCDL